MASRLKTTGSNPAITPTITPATTPALSPRRICETFAGNLAHTVGRLAFRPGRPMLVEHVGGLYLEHALDGTVLTPGYDDDYKIVHVWEEERQAA